LGPRSVPTARLRRATARQARNGVFSFGAFISFASFRVLSGQFNPSSLSPAHKSFKNPPMTSGHYRIEPHYSPRGTRRRAPHSPDRPKRKRCKYEPKEANKTKMQGPITKRVLSSVWRYSGEIHYIRRPHSAFDSPCGATRNYSQYLPARSESSDLPLARLAPRW